MKEIEVKFNCKIPDGLSDEQVQEFIEFYLGCRGSMSKFNPACGENIEIRNVEFGFD